MKKQRWIYAGIIGFALVFTAAAVVEQPFPGWAALMRQSADVVIVRCLKTPELVLVGKNGYEIDRLDGLVDSDVEVVSTIKGNQSAAQGAVHLNSRYWPRQGEFYLIFSMFHDGDFQAVEPYRVIPLGLSLPGGLPRGKTPEEMVQSIFDYRIEELDRESKAAEQERQRLAGGIKK